MVYLLVTELLKLQYRIKIFSLPQPFGLMPLRACSLFLKIFPDINIIINQLSCPSSKEKVTEKNTFVKEKVNNY